MGRSRGRHAAPRSGFSKAVGFVVGGAALLVVAGVLVSVGVPLASSGSAPSPTPTARVSMFELNGFAKGPAKVAPAAPYVPKTVLDPDAVADPYPIPQAPAAPAAPAAPSAPAPGTPAPGAGG